MIKKYVTQEEYNKLESEGKLYDFIEYVVVDPYDREIKQISYNTINKRDYNSLAPYKYSDFYLMKPIVLTTMQAKSTVLVSSKIQMNQRTRMKTRGLAIVKSHIRLQQATKLIIMSTMSKNDYASRMLDYLPWYEKPSKIYREILKAEDAELKRLEHNLEIAYKNTWIDTAVEGLDTYERDFAITPKDKYDYMFRRNIVKARYQMISAQMNLKNIKRFIKLLSNNTAEIEIQEVSTGMYEITFVGQIGIPKDMDLIREAMKIVWPAHLGYNFKYRFTTWNDLRDTQYVETQEKTWDSIKIWKEKIKEI